MGPLRCGGGDRRHSSFRNPDIQIVGCSNTIMDVEIKLSFSMLLPTAADAASVTTLSPSPIYEGKGCASRSFTTPFPYFRPSRLFYPQLSSSSSYMPSYPRKISCASTATRHSASDILGWEYAPRSMKHQYYTTYSYSQY